MHPIVRVLLRGVYDPQSPLHIIRGLPVLPIIWEEVKADYIVNSHLYLKAPKPKEKAYIRYDESKGFSHIEISESAYCGVVSRRMGSLFPPPQDIVINMMPFVLGDIGSLPEEYRHYWGMIEDCKLEQERMGTIGYLTIHESLVEKGNTQRRPGLHTDAAGLVKTSQFVTVNTRWGTGDKYHKKSGGIYIASNVHKSCRYWNMKVSRKRKIVDKGGYIEHLRFLLLGKGSMMDANTIYWMTDLTPHESLPVKSTQYRQFFRLVAGDVSVWYDKHSTKNRLGVEPNAVILYNDKFKDTDSDSE